MVQAFAEITIHLSSFSASGLFFFFFFIFDLFRAISVIENDLQVTRIYNLYLHYLILVGVEGEMMIPLK